MDHKTAASDSFIVRDAKTGSTTGYIGPDATELFRAIMLKSSIAMWIKCRMIPTRGMGITKMLKMVPRYTGKTYTTKQAALAVADLETWIATMKSALPVIINQ